MTINVPITVRPLEGFPDVQWMRGRVHQCNGCFRDNCRLWVIWGRGHIVGGTFVHYGGRLVRHPHREKTEARIACDSCLGELLQDIHDLLTARYLRWKEHKKNEVRA